MASIRIIGITASLGRARAPVAFFDQNAWVAGQQPQAPHIAVVHGRLVPQAVSDNREAVGFVAEEGSITAHAANLCRERGIPLIVRADGLDALNTSKRYIAEIVVNEEGYAVFEDSKL